MPRQYDEVLDVDVIDRSALDETHQKLHPQPWLLVHADGNTEYFDTEDAACSRQRAIRLARGLDPMTGENWNV